MGSTSEMFSVRYKIYRLPDRSNVQLGFPDPFAVMTVSGEQTKTTSVIKRTLNPYWNESFDVYVYNPTPKEKSRVDIWIAEHQRTVSSPYKYLIKRNSRRRTKVFSVS